MKPSLGCNNPPCSVEAYNELKRCKYVLQDRIVPLLPSHKRKKKAGRPRMNDRKAMSAIFYVLSTGCQWNALPRSLGASGTGT